MRYATPGRIISVGHAVVDDYPSPPQRRFARPSLGPTSWQVAGRAVPYGIALRVPARGDLIVFDEDTRWTIPDMIEIRCEHKPGPLGAGYIEESPSGLHLRGEIYRPADRRYELSPSLSDVDLDPRPNRDGSRHVTAARLDEVSLCRSAQWGEHCLAGVHAA